MIRRLGVVLLALLASHGAFGATPRLEADDLAAADTVFRYATQACDRTDVPDVPARAFRLGDGSVRLIASHATARLFAGPDLDSLHHDCAVVFDSRRSGEPAAYADHTWISAPYAIDGGRIVALASNEFHGHKRPDLCPAARYAECWWNAIVLLASSDGGRSFQAAAGGRHLVAVPPWRYRGDLGRRAGLFAPSNIVQRDGHFHVFLWAEALADQARGACLMRTDRLDDPASWRAFDGVAFTVAFADPYRPDIDRPARHVCAPVAPERLTATVRSLVWHAPSASWIALMAMSRPAPGGPAATGIWWASSPDLIRWSVPQLLLAMPLLTHRDCARGEAFYYPSLIDPASPSRNFETVGGHAHLYLTRLNLRDCRPTWDRDLVRLAVRITAED